MSKNPQISIIVPVYNSAERISRTIDSLLGQTLAEIEVIVLDDASTDGTLQILQKYAAADKRLKVVSDGVNKGPGNRRNQGIALARGEYVMLADGDDWLEPDACTLLAQKMQGTDCEAICFNAWADRGEQSKAIEYYKVKEEFCGSWRDVCAEVFKTAFHSWHWCFRRSFLQQYDLRYSSYPPFEDVPFVLGALLKAEKILFWPRKLYHYMQNEGSLVHKTSDKFMSVFDIFAEIEQILGDTGTVDIFAPQFKKWQERHLRFCANKLSPGKRPEFLRLARQICPGCKTGKWFLLWKLKFLGIPFVSAYQPSAGEIDYRLFGLPAAKKRMTASSCKIYLFGLPLIKITCPE